mmetsp:Transcript_68270/g.120810  ORF Transcript_68270/g.120810 Transcript_68270/m.120810 type:complete len:506 (-) Transcript_68270:592-2109(-)
MGSRKVGIKVQEYGDHYQKFENLLKNDLPCFRSATLARRKVLRARRPKGYLTSPKSSSSHPSVLTMDKIFGQEIKPVEEFDEHPATVQALSWLHRARQAKNKMQAPKRSERLLKVSSHLPLGMTAKPGSPRMIGLPTDEVGEMNVTESCTQEENFAPNSPPRSRLQQTSKSPGSLRKMVVQVRAGLSLGQLSAPSSIENDLKASPSSLREVTSPVFHSPTSTIGSHHTHRQKRQPTDMWSQVGSAHSASSQQRTKARRPRYNRPSSPTTKIMITQTQFLKVKAIFDDIDVLGSGGVTLKDLLEYSVKHPIPVKVFQRMTLDNDGIITLPEMLRCYYPKVSIKDLKYATQTFSAQLQSNWREKLNEQSMAEIKEIFDVYDRPGKGSFSFDELWAQLNHSEGLDYDELMLVMHRAEVDPDYELGIQDFETLLRDYFIQQQYSTTGHPTLDFLTHNRRIANGWSRIFPHLPDTVALLAPAKSSDQRSTGPASAESLNTSGSPKNVSKT